MDPNETLKKLRRLLVPTGFGIDEQDDVAELFVALDEWLSKGGALPEDWARRDPEPNRAPADPFA